MGGTVLFGAGDGTFTVGPTNTAIASATNYLSRRGRQPEKQRQARRGCHRSRDSSPSIYGNGDGTFTTGPSYAALPDYMQVTITDIDGDGNPDIVLGTSTGGIYTDGGYDIEPPLFQILMGLRRRHLCRLAGLQPGDVRRPRHANNSELEIASADFIGERQARCAGV